MNNKRRSIEEFVRQYETDEKRALRSLRGELKGGESDDIYTEVTMTDTEFKSLIIDLLLGKDWYVVDPLGCGQINSIAFMDIKEIYGDINKRKKNIFKRILKHIV